LAARPLIALAKALPTLAAAFQHILPSVTTSLLVSEFFDIIRMDANKIHR
jgi:hypothetical protein